jgi:hypothetical protein
LVTADLRFAEVNYIPYGFPKWWMNEPENEKSSSAYLGHICAIPMVHNSRRLVAAPLSDSSSSFASLSSFSQLSGRAYPDRKSCSPWKKKEFNQPLKNLMCSEVPPSVPALEPNPKITSCKKNVQLPLSLRPGNLGPAAPQVPPSKKCLKISTDPAVDHHSHIPRFQFAKNDSRLLGLIWYPKFDS